MVVSDASIHNIMGGMESTAGVRLHNHRRKLKQRFDIIKKLGQGTYGKVQLGINKETGQEVAIKTIKKAKIETEADLVRIRREIQIMSSVQHPNIIHIYEVFENREKMVLVMEYAAGGELYDFLSEKKVLAEEEARRIFRQIATAVYYCHKHKICHRDLKLENILLDEHGSAKIADFGLSNVFNEQRLLNTFCGSPLYASPEIVKGTPYHGPEVDCWSLGVLLYTLVYGAMPFDGSNFKRLVKQISQGDYFEPKKPSSASPLIREMLTVTPARRANIEKICSHWWVNEGHTESCLEIAEELANQTPVRLDLLLSLAPPPPAVGSDMILTDDKAAGDSHTAHSDTVAPARCHSVGSLMDLDQPSAERKIQEFERHKQKGSGGDGAAAVKDAPKRKLEEGISTEIVPSGAKKKEWCRRSNSESRPASLVEEKSPEEKMDVDVDVSEPRSSEASKAVSESVSKNEEVVKDTQVIEGACALIEATSTETATQKSPGAEASKASIGRDKTTRKSVKGSTKKSKPATISSTDNVPSSIKTLPNKEEELKSKTKAEEEVSVVESNTEGPTTAPSESSKEKTSEEAPVTEAVKQKVKKKKKVTSLKSEEIATESAEKKVDSESSLIALNSKPEDSSSQEAEKELKKEVAEPEENENSESPSSKDSSSVKTADAPKAGSVKTKKSRPDLSLGKLGSSSDKSSGSEDLVSPTKTVERRRSKIFENSDQFNIFLRGSEQKPVENKPKKVFIPGVKVSDYKQAFERRSSLTPSSSQSPLKTPASKKAVESSSTSTAPCDSSPSDGKSSEVSSSATDSTLNSSADILETPSKTQEDPASSTETQSSKDIDQNSVESNSNASKPEINGTRTEAAELAQPSKDEEAELELVPALQVTDKMSQQEKARIKKLKDAVDIISNAIAEETRKESSDSPPVRKISTGKPPVPMSPEKSKSKAAASTKSPPVTPSEKKSMKIPSSSDGGAAAAEITEKAQQQNPGESSHKGVNATAEPEAEKVTPAKKKSAKVEITLKSATLPRRRTSKAEIQLGYPPSKIPESGPAGEYRTEVEHMVGTSNPARLQTQRSEVAFPVAAATNVQPLSFRSASLEPEGTPKVKSKPKERIIPIRLESEKEEIRPQSQPQPPPPARPPVPPVQTQRSISQRSSSLSRQSTQDSDTDSTISASGPEPIRKSPREFIIPIAVEGGGYVTPRAGSLEPSLSEASTETSQQQRRSGRSSSRLRKMGSLLSDSEDEGFNSPFVTLQRHGSVTREGENPDDERPFHHMHRLRSSKPRRPTLEHNDSLSSAEEEDDDDDDGFEILTAESLFSTLLSRVRSLTQRLNVEDGGRSGFPSSRLMSHLAASGHSSPSSGFWSNVYGFPGEPLSRRVSESSQFPRPFGPNGEGPTPWRRSASRDNSDVDSVYSEADAGSLPRGSSRFDSGNLSDDPGFDNSSSCYYTPALARRMQRPWRSSSQSLGYQSPLSQEGTMSDSDWLMHHRKSSLGSMPTQNSNIPHQHPSCRLARTLSLHSRTDERRGKDLPSPHPMDYGRRMDYQPSTRRTLSILESGIPVHSDSSDRVLPPLPSRDRRRDSSRSSVYSRQPSADLSNSQYSQYSKSNDESTSIRPHHSSSLPTMSRIKSKKSSDGSKTSEKIIREPKIPESEPTITPTSRRVSSHRSLLDNGNASDRTKIPSLSHLRSSSLVRDGNKGTNYAETNTGSTVKKSSSTCSTSDRSILSKFLRQGSEEKDVSKATENTEDNKDDPKKKRRISRFLRPDFYDTPREESEYAKKKDAKKAAETESKLKSKNNNKKLDSPPLVSVKNDSETKAKGMSEISLQAKESESKLKSKTNSKKLDSPPLVSVKNNSETKAISEASSQAKETDIKLKSKTNSKKLDNSQPIQQKLDSESQTSHISEASLQTKEATTKLKSKTNSKKLDNATSVPEKNGSQPEPKNISDVSLQAKEAETMLKPAASDIKVDNSISVPERNVSESQIPSISETLSQNKENKSVPIAVDKNVVSVQAKKVVMASKKQNGKEVKAADETKQNSSTKNNDKKPEANSPAFEKQPSNKNKFLLSLERKLEKFRSSGDDIPSTVNTGKSRVDKAIRSLREQSLSHQGGDITESNLIKRAVSVDDLDSTPKESYGSKIGSKVTSVLGLFRKLEDTPAKTSQSPPKTSVLTRLRRTQSVYAGSQSDSVLVGNVNDSNDGTPVPPLRLKKTNSNSSVKNSTSNTANKGTDKTIKTKPTDKENVLHNKETSQNAGKLSGFSNSETALTDVGKGVAKLIRKGSVKLKSKNKQEAESINHSEPSLDQVSGIGIPESVTAGSMLKPARPASFCAPLQDSIPAVTPGAREDILTFNLPRPSSTIISSISHIDSPNERPVNSIENTVSLPETRMSSNVCEIIKDSNGVINEQKLPFENKIIPINADVNTITNGDIPLSLSNDINQLPNDDYTLNDDEVKFANVKRLDSCGDECSVASPADELESLDSWSICSDFDGREFPTSPVPPLGDDVEESVVDRIRRKSFYSRFNDIKKKHRKSSLSSLSSSYRDPNSLSSLYYQQSVPRKKEHSSGHHHHHHHHSSHHDKPSRSQSLYDYDPRSTTLHRKSPLPLRTQTSYQGDLSLNSLGTENENHDMNGYVESTRELRDENPRGEVTSNVHCLGGSMETLRMPRHFNSKINLGTTSYHVPTYSGPVRRASDSHLSRSMESSIGSIIPRSQLPISTSRFSNTLISPSDSMMRMGDTLPVHGKYTRYKSPNPLDSPPMFHIGSLTAEEEYERPITPH